MTTKTTTPAQPKTPSRILGFMAGAGMAFLLVAFGAMIGGSHPAKAETPAPVAVVHKVHHRHHAAHTPSCMAHPKTVVITETY